MQEDESKPKRVVLTGVPAGDLPRRLWPVLAGYERMGWSVRDIIAVLGDCEISLWDYQNCSQCQAQGLKRVGDKYTVVADCASSLGGGYYLGLHQKAVMQYRRPVFGAIGCGGPVAWKARQVSRVRAGRDWMGDELAPPPGPGDEPGLSTIQDRIDRWARGYAQLNLGIGGTASG